MNDFSHEHPASPMRGMRRLVFLLLAVLVGLLVFYGCGGNSPDPKPSGDGNSGAPGGNNLLTVAMDMMQPDRLGIDSQPDRVASVLNQWRLSQLESSEAERFSPPLEKDAREFLASQLSSEALAQAEEDDFSQRDAAHIRTSILMRAIVDDVARGLDSDLERARILFDYVSRNVQLIAEENALPLSPYEILVFGEGTAADRAWIFANLLRQLKLDAVIIKPGPGEEFAEEAAPWFVAAIIDNQARLFDPSRSTPVPGHPAASPEQTTPASLADLSQPGVWEALAGASDAKRLQAAFEQPRVEIIGTSLVWAPRHVRLQRFLAGDASVVISENLMADSPESTSILKRVAGIKNAQWKREDIRIWPHPQSRLRNFETLDATDLQSRWMPFQAPMQIVRHPQTHQVLVGPPATRQQLKTRTEQLLGERRMAIQGYTQVRLDYKHIPPAAPVPVEIRSMHADAAEDAFFWSGVCQMELGEMEAAAGTFRSYLGKAQFSQGRHTDHARLLLARCQLELDQPADALKSLAAIPDASPQAATATFLRRAWASRAEPSAAPMPEKPEPKSEPKTETPPEPKAETSSNPPAAGPAVADKPPR